MSTATTTPARRVGRARRTVSVVALTGLVLSLAGAPTPSTAATAAGTADRAQVSAPVASLADTTTSARKKKRRFGKMRVGISTGFSITYADDARLDNDLTKAKRFGADQLRLDISWALIQPERNVVDWARTDRLFNRAKAKGVNVLAVIGFAPEWGKYQSGPQEGAVRPEAFADFVDAAARRYKFKAAAWEIWNEPNQTRSWIAPPDPAAYARVVEAASKPIRRHDPKAKILMGSLAPAVDDPAGVEISPITFLEGVYDAGIRRGAYDAVSVHPFSYPALPSGDEEWNTFNRLPDIYSVLRRNGDGRKPLWLTEYGARTGSSERSVSYKRQSRLMVDAYREAKKLPFVQALFFYSLRDAADNLREPEDNFGMLKFNGQPKPVYKKLKRLIRKGR